MNSWYSEFNKKQKPYAGFSGMGGGAMGLANKMAVGHPFEQMSNYPGATQLSDDLIYYHTAGQYIFPADGSTFRFTVVGGGGGSDGDGGGWYGVTGGGGGGAARAVITASQTLYIGVGQGGEGLNSPTGQDSTYYVASIQGTEIKNATYQRSRGRGGHSYVKISSHSAPFPNTLMAGTGGMQGMYGYHATAYPNINPYGGYTYPHPQGFYSNSTVSHTVNMWDNHGFGWTNPHASLSSPYTEPGGVGGCAAHKSGNPWNNSGTDPTGAPIHPRDGAILNGNHPSSQYKGTSGAPSAVKGSGWGGAGGGGGSDQADQYQNTYVAGAAGGSSPALSTLLSGSGLTFGGGSGSNYSYPGFQATAGGVGSGAGGNSRYTNSDTWNQNLSGGDGIVVVEYLG